MKLHSHKNSERKTNKYQHNLQDIVNISNHKHIPSIPAHTDDFNFTFLIKDYDEANPYLNKNSLRNSSNKMSKNQHETFPFQENLFDMPLMENSESSILMKKQNNQESFKLPNINSQKNKSSEQQKGRKNSMKPKDKERYTQKQKQSKTQKSIKYNRSFTIDTRIQTDDNSILQNGSASSLLKIETKSLCKSIQSQPFSHLKISKINNPEVNMVKNHKNFLSRHNLLSRDLSEFSRLVQLSPTKSIDQQMIEEEQSTGSESQQEYIKDSVPGPGAYSISHHSSFSKPSLSKTINRTGTKGFNFGSRQNRFKPQRQQEQNFEFYQLKLLQYERRQKQRQERLLTLNKRQKKVVPFNSKQQPKQPTINRDFMNSIISPVYYNPRNGIEEELIKKIQRNFKGGFGFAQKRFRTVYRKNPDIGPGSYSVDINTIEQEQPKKQAYYFLSKKNRFQ